MSTTQKNPAHLCTRSVDVLLEYHLPYRASVEVLTFWKAVVLQQSHGQYTV